jgi:hypothetical protein
MEAYAKKLSISEKVYQKEHGGRALSDTKKMAIARVLANTSEFLNEAFETSVGTQLANMKTFKKFCLDLTTVALPNLIANDLVIVFPLKSRTGYIQYLQFTAGSNKGGVAQGDVFNDVFRLGQMNDDRMNYTAAAVVENFTGDGETVALDMTWTPVVAVAKVVVDGAELPADGYTVDGNTVTLAQAPAAEAVIKVAYTYDNVIIPQNDLPILNAHMEGIELAAKARRIAVYYSQMAAFQAKTEMGIDLGEILATQACAELSYEIDTEVVKLLADNAVAHDDLTWNKRCPVGVGKRDHYAGFAEVVELGSQHIYDATQKHAANYMIASSAIKPVLALMEGWKAASTSKINGPYFAGELNGIKVFVSPAIAAGEFVLGYNGDDMVTSAAVYAPYMAIIPTQLLGFADGSMSQGFSTLYDLKMLNPYLLVKGKVVDQDFVSGIIAHPANEATGD